MRIKINGPITADRLAEALEKAAEKCGENFGGFFGGNLYVNAFNKDGEAVQLVDCKGNV